MACQRPSGLRPPQVRSGIPTTRGLRPPQVRSGIPAACGLRPPQVRSGIPAACGLRPPQVRSGIPAACGLRSSQVRSRVPTTCGLRAPQVRSGMPAACGLRQPQATGAIPKRPRPCPDLQEVQRGPCVPQLNTGQATGGAPCAVRTRSIPTRFSSRLCRPSPLPTPGSYASQPPCPRSPVHTSPVHASPVHVSPPCATPPQGSPSHTSPVCASPARGSSVCASPARGSPVCASPAHGSPVCASPARGSPVGTSPAHGSPVCASPPRSSPLVGNLFSPIAESPARSTPVSGIPVYARDLQAAPMYRSPVGQLISPLREPAYQPPVFGGTPIYAANYNQPIYSSSPARESTGRASPVNLIPGNVCTDPCTRTEPPLGNLISPIRDSPVRRFTGRRSPCPASRRLFFEGDDPQISPPTDDYDVKEASARAASPCRRSPPPTAARFDDDILNTTPPCDLDITLNEDIPEAPIPLQSTPCRRPDFDMQLFADQGEVPCLSQESPPPDFFHDSICSDDSIQELPCQPVQDNRYALCCPTETQRPTVPRPWNYFTSVLMQRVEESNTPGIEEEEYPLVEFPDDSMNEMEQSYEIGPLATEAAGFNSFEEDCIEPSWSFSREIIKLEKSG